MCSSLSTCPQKSSSPNHSPLILRNFLNSSPYFFTSYSPLNLSLVEVDVYQGHPQPPRYWMQEGFLGPVLSDNHNDGITHRSTEHFLYATYDPPYCADFISSSLQVDEGRFTSCLSLRFFLPLLVSIWGCSWLGPLKHWCPPGSNLGSSSLGCSHPVSGLNYYTRKSQPVPLARLLTGLSNWSTVTLTDVSGLMCPRGPQFLPPTWIRSFLCSPGILHSLLPRPDHPTL